MPGEIRNNMRKLHISNETFVIMGTEYMPYDRLRGRAYVASFFHWVVVFITIF
jgi:hypothetical protein